MFGPKETESIPEIRLLMIPHSRPAWIAVTLASSFVYSFQARATKAASGEWMLGVQEG